MDDDLPPPLASLPGQVQALSGKHTTTLSESEDMPVAIASIIETAQTTDTKKTGTIKRGFFDTKPAAKAKPSRPLAPQQFSAKKDDITSIKASRDNISSGKHIPSFMMLEPDEQMKAMEAYKKDLVNKLKPTDDMVTRISANPVLAQGFDDPEVMAAVNDVAANPSHIKKYEKNAKVHQFYAAMGQVMGQRLEELDGKDKPAAQPASAAASRAQQKTSPQASRAQQKATAQKPAASTAAPEPTSAGAAAAAALLTGQRPSQDVDIRPLMTRCCIYELD